MSTARERENEIIKRINAQSEALMLLAEDRWRSMTDEDRMKLMKLCCRDCGVMDPTCRCGDDSWR